MKGVVLFNKIEKGPPVSFYFYKLPYKLMLCCTYQYQLDTVPVDIIGRGWSFYDGEK